EVLIALDHAVVGEAVRGLGQKGLRLYFGVDGLGEGLAEGEAKDEGAEIVDVGDGAEILKEAAFAAEGDVLATLMLAVDNAEVGKADVGGVAGAGGGGGAAGAPRAGRGARAAGC